MRHFRKLYVQVLVGVACGVLVGFVWPALGTQLKPLADLFIRLIRLVVAPVIFCTVAGGIATMVDLKAVGRVGGKAIIYFELVSTLALALGLLVGTVLKPGAGFNIDPGSLDPQGAADYMTQAKHDGSTVDYVLHLVPDNFFGAFVGGELVQVLIVALLAGLACSRMGELGQQTAATLDKIAKLFFAIIHLVVRLAPLAAFGAMGFTIGKYGIGSLVQLGALVLTFYVTSALFVLVVLGGICAWCGFSIFKFLAYIREEIVICLGASSSEPTLPLMIEKLQRLGVAKPVVGLVIPTGYSFNLDGTNIYLTLAILFLAQSLNIDLSIGQQLAILGVAVLTSKGAAAVTGGGFITLAATLAVVKDIPIGAIALLVGVDRFMSECRSLTNLIGNGVATVAVARWDGQVDMERLRRELDRGPRMVEAARDAEAPIPQPHLSADADTAASAETHDRQGV